MSMCPICNSEGYCGLNIFECSNPTCSNFSISLYTQLNRAIKEEKEIDDDTYDYGDDNNRDYDYNPNDPPIELPLGFAPQWFQLGKSHRAEKPAVELPEDCSEGLNTGHLYKERGPAVEASAIHDNDKFHREDGPAVESHGPDAWYNAGKDK